MVSCFDHDAPFFWKEKIPSVVPTSSLFNCDSPVVSD
jgi:hypothetical protein